LLSLPPAIEAYFEASWSTHFPIQRRRHRSRATTLDLDPDRSQRS
jgi:hypothetical protein